MYGVWRGWVLGLGDPRFVFHEMHLWEAFRHLKLSGFPPQTYSIGLTEPLPTPVEESNPKVSASCWEGYDGQAEKSGYSTVQCRVV